MIVQFRIRPRLDGSTTDAGRAALKVDMIAVYSSCVMVPSVTACLLIVSVVEPMPELASSL